MYNFNYFSPYVKPKSKRGYYAAILGLAVLLTIGLLIAVTVFMKLKIKEQRDRINSITTQINDPNLAAEIKKGIEFSEKIKEVNQDKLACESLEEAMPFFNGLSIETLNNIENCLLDDSFLMNVSFNTDSIEMDVVSKYEAYVPTIQLFQNLQKANPSWEVDVSNLVDPFYYEEHSFEYVRFPVILYQNGGSSR